MGIPWGLCKDVYAEWQEDEACNGSVQVDEQKCPLKGYGCIGVYSNSGD